MDDDDAFDDILAQIPEVEVPPPEKLAKQNVAAAENAIKKTPSSSFSILVNPKQKGNPLLSSVTNIPWEFADVVPDYVMGATTCALFLSIRYHNMNPDYIHDRLKLLGKAYTLRVLLVLVDVGDPHLALKNLTRICLLADLTLMLAFNSEDAGKIIETYKIYENKPPDRIMEKVENDPYQKVLGIVSALTSIKPVNKTDALTLLTNFGTLEKILKATKSQLSNCPGMGPRKASKLFDVLHEQFLKKNLATNTKKDDDDLNIEEIETLIENAP